MMGIRDYRYQIVLTIKAFPAKRNSIAVNRILRVYYHPKEEFRNDNKR